MPQVSPIIKMEFTPENDTVIYARGVPFGSPERRDLQGEFFDAETDFGDERVKTVNAYFDHGMDRAILTNYIMELDKNISLEKAAQIAESIGFGKQQIGIAERFQEDPEGIIYRIILDRKHRYNEFLKDLLEQGLLGVSSGTKFRESDPNVPGRIALWHVCDMSLTPTSASTDAQVLIVKSLEEVMAKAKSVEETPAVTPPAEPATEVVEEKKEEETPVNPIIEGIEKAFAPVTDEKNVDTEEEDVKSLLKELISLVKTGFGGLSTEIGHVEEALPVLADKIAKSMSGGEKSVATEVKVVKSASPTRPGMGQFPPNAPGSK